MTFVTITDRPKSVRYRCVIDVFGGVCLLSFGFRIFCLYMGFCHMTESDLLLFLIQFPGKNRGHWASSDVTKNDVISDNVILQQINFRIKLQYKFAIVCENLKIVCLVVSEILYLSHYLLDDLRTCDL